MFRSRGESLKHLNKINNKLKQREFFGIRYVFGSKFRESEELSDIFTIWEDQGHPTENAVDIIYEVLIACGYKSLAKTIDQSQQPNIDRCDFLIRKEVALTLMQAVGVKELEMIQLKAMIVRVTDKLIADKQWKSFRMFIGTGENVHNELSDPYDLFRNLERTLELTPEKIIGTLQDMDQHELIHLVADYTGDYNYNYDYYYHVITTIIYIL